MSAAPKVLIVRFSAIGDTLMDTWAVSSLRRNCPEATIHWLVESRCAPVLDTGRLLDRRIEVPRKGADGQKSKGTMLKQLRLYASLRSEDYDVGVDLQGHSKTVIALRLAAPRRRFLARAKDTLAGWMGPVAPHKGTHHVEIAAEVLERATGIALTVDERPILPPAPACERDLALIAVSAGRPERALNQAAITAVARSLVSGGMRVELIGGPNDSAPSDSGGAENRVGKMSLAETLARVAQSSLLVAGDTGAGHMAAAYGTPVVSVFGPAPSALTRPWTDRLERIEGGERTDSVDGATILAACDRLRERCGF